MGLFSRKAAAPLALPAAAGEARVYQPTPDDQDLISLMEANGDLGVTLAIERAVRKGLTASNYVTFDNMDDQGGYYGTEFELRSTAGRIKGLYSREPWIFAAATRIAQTVASVPMKVYPVGGDKEIPNHPVAAVWAQGSPSQSALELKWTENLDLSLGGNYFLLLEEDMKTVAGLAPVELVNLQYSPDFTRVTAIDVYAAGSGIQYRRFPIEQVIHVKMPNPYNFMYGMSPFCAAARPILLDRYKNEFEMAFYLRGCSSPGVVETTEDLSKSRFKRLMATFEQTFTGRSNWWRTLFLPKGAKWQSSTLTMREMQHLEGLRENRLTILAVLGVPPSIVGIVQDVNRATAEQQERTFWQNTVCPLAGFIASGWNNSFLVKGTFKGQVELRPDFSGVEAVQGFVSAKGEKATAMAPYFLIDEIREKVWGEGPVPGGGGARFAAEIKPVPGAATGAPPTPALPPAGKAVIPAGHEPVFLYLTKDRFTTEGAAIKWAADNGFKYAPCTDMKDAWCIPQANPDDHDMQQMSDVALSDGVRVTCAPPKAKAEEARRAAFARAKASATGSQNRIEAKAGAELARAVSGYEALLLDEARAAILRKAHVRVALENHRAERLSFWQERAFPALYAALERGFAAGASQVKDARRLGAEKRAGFPGLSEVDRQAADVLRERQRDGRRRTLADRGIERFAGLDATRTDAVMDLIAKGEAEGRSYEEIARELRDRFDEAYGNQARTIVRTEILSAVSEGLAWNHDVLGEIFSDVRKQWMHQGDENKDARQEHVDLDGQEVGGDDAWTVVDAKGEAIELKYPRDPDAPAGQVINCRCTMVSVIPEGSNSNADSILEQA